MEKKFIFAKDIEALLRQDKTEMVLTGRTRFSPAAWDLIREKGIQVAFTGASSEKELDEPEVIPSQGDAPKKIKPAGHGLIAVASRGRDITGPVGRSAAREPFFLIFDIEGHYIDVIKNPYANRSDAIDPLIAKLMASIQLSAIVAETFGSSLRTHLEAKKVQCVETSGRIQRAVKMVIDRKLLRHRET